MELMGKAMADAEEVGAAASNYLNQFAINTLGYVWAVLDTGGSLGGCVDTHSIDSDADGTPDYVSSTRVDGASTVIRVDSDGDGQLDERSEFTRDPNSGLLLLRETRSFPGNLLIYRLVTTVDAQGRAERIQTDTDGDGIVNDTQEWTFHASGATASFITSFDADDDGTVDQTLSWSYDLQGRPVSFQQDSGADGSIDSSEIWSYAPDGFTNEVYGAAGVLSSRVQVTYDAQGRTVLTQRDNDGDGTFSSVSDEVLTFTYTTNGAADVDTVDGGAGLTPDGVPDVRTERLYDASNRLVQRTVLQVADLTVLQRQTYVYDAQGNQASQEDDLDGDGTILSGWIRTFDANGRVLTDTTLQGGLPTTIITSTYTAGGQLEFQGYDGNADGTDDLAVFNTFDGFGRILQSAHDNDGDGLPNSIQSYAYSCVP
jgi:hypothetical protein